MIVVVRKKKSGLGSPPRHRQISLDHFNSLGYTTTQHFAIFRLALILLSLKSYFGATLRDNQNHSGMLVVNVTWRNRSYVGTLLDASRHDWAPPR